MGIRDQAGRRGGQSGRELDLLDLLGEAGAEPGQQAGQLLALLLQPGLGFLLLVFAAQLQRASGGRAEGLALEVGHLLDPDGVHGVLQEQHLVALLAEGLQVGRVLQDRAVLAGQVVDGLLLGLHPRDVVGQRGRFGGLGRREQAKLQQGALLVGFAEEALLEDPSELVPEGAVGLGPVLLHLFEGGGDLAGQALADGPDLAILLQDLARDVQREVLGVHHPAHEAQVIGKKLLAAVHDEDPLDVELHAPASIRDEEVQRGLGRDEEQGLELEGALALHRDRLQGVRPVVGDVPVELVVLLGLDLIGRTGPQGLHGVQGGVLGGLALADLHPDGMGQEVRIALDQAAQDPLRGVVGQAVLRVGGFQVQGDHGSLGRTLDVFEGVGALSGRFPAGSRGLAGPTGLQGHPVGHHEHRVEADSELTDHLGRGPLVPALA